jgi:hypothetical protein
VRQVQRPPLVLEDAILQVRAPASSAANKRSEGSHEAPSPFLEGKRLANGNDSSCSD